MVLPDGTTFWDLGASDPLRLGASLRKLQTLCTCGWVFIPRLSWYEEASNQSCGEETSCWDQMQPRKIHSIPNYRYEFGWLSGMHHITRSLNLLSYELIYTHVLRWVSIVCGYYLPGCTWSTTRIITSYSSRFFQAKPLFANDGILVGGSGRPLPQSLLKSSCELQGASLFADTTRTWLSNDAGQSLIAKWS